MTSCLGTPTCYGLTFTSATCQKNTLIFTHVPSLLIACEAGYYREPEAVQCSACPIATYKTGTGNDITSCIPCDTDNPESKTTVNTASTQQSQCGKLLSTFCF